MGFKRSWVRIPPARCIDSPPCFTFMYCAARRRAAGMWGRVRTSMSVFGGTILVIPRPRVTESHGL